MLIINRSKPCYIDIKNKKIRLGNFADTGKELDYEDESILSVFKNTKEPISKIDLINIVNSETNIVKEEIELAIDYLIEEKFIIDFNNYNNIIENNIYNRQNLFFNMFTDELKEYTNVLKDKKILILGLGGIGSNSAMVLSRTGFNNFTLVDCDKVETSNLIRQFPYTKEDIGKLKTECLYNKIKNNYNSVFVKNQMILNKQDIEKEIMNSDFVLCTLDKPMRVIRRLINEICVKTEIPVLFCGFSEHTGMIGPFVIPNKTACLSCIENNFTEEPLENVTIVPSYGPLCLLISSIVCNEIINYFVKYNSNNLCGKTLMFNFATYDSKIINWDKKNNCKECGVHDIK